MELPFTVVFEPPSRAELRAVLRMRGTWLVAALVVLAIGTATFLLSSLGRTDAVASSAGVPFAVTSRPSGAGVWLDGRQQGYTPLEVVVQPGAHAVVLKTSDALDGQYAVQVGGAEPAALEAILWRRQPTLMHLRPTLPGAVLSDVRLLSDGELALSIALPPGPQLQAWLLDPQTGAVRRVLTDVVGTRLAVAPDSQHIALLGYDVGPPVSGSGASGSGSERASVLWLASVGGSAPTAGWRPPVAPDEQLLDASWSPDADRLLAVTSQTLSGGAVRSHVWFVDADGQAGRVVLTLPSEIVAGSELWSADGQHVAFLAHAGALNALCLVDLDGGFRYVADLDPSAAPPLAYIPGAWASDSQRLLFVARHQRPPGAPVGWLQTDPQRALYVASLADPTPQLIADTDADLAAWREDGQMLGLGRLGDNGGLALHLVAGSGNGQRLLELPLKPGANYAAAWDLRRARVLVASKSTSGGVDYWLAMLGFEGER